MNHLSEGQNCMSPLSLEPASNLTLASVGGSGQGLSVVPQQFN